jgi:hypothetical protein
MRFDLNSKSVLGASCIALSIAGAALPVVASAQTVGFPTVPTTRVRSFNNLGNIKINDPCAGLETTPELCPALQDDSTDVPLLDPATPYPSTITVPAAAFVAGSKITDVNVTIKGIAHHYLNDIDVLLVGPGGEYVIPFSNVSNTGGSHIDSTAIPLSWKFDDSAKLPLPHANNNDGRASTRATTGTGANQVPNPLYSLIYPEWTGVWTDPSVRLFKPSDYDASSATESTDTDIFPLPAPQTVNGNSPQVVVTHNPPTLNPTVTGGGKLAVFNNTSPVGTWSLYVADDYFFYDGAITGGWELEITAKQP